MTHIKCITKFSTKRIAKKYFPQRILIKLDRDNDSLNSLTIRC